MKTTNTIMTNTAARNEISKQEGKKMKNSEKILEEIRINANEAERLEDEVRRAKLSERSLPEIAEKSERAAMLRVTNKILRDNARWAFVDEIMPAIIATVEKYAGKAYGPKTKEAIKEEMKTRIGCAVYFKEEEYRGDRVVIVPLDKNGHSSTGFFRYGDLELETVPDGESYIKLLDKNKIKSIRADALRLTNCAPCPERETEERAKTIIARRRKILESWRELEDQITKYNNLLPSSIDSVSSWHFSGAINL